MTGPDVDGQSTGTRLLRTQGVTAPEGFRATGIAAGIKAVDGLTDKPPNFGKMFEGVLGMIPGGALAKVLGPFSKIGGTAGKFVEMFAQTAGFPVRMPVHFLGIWDSVKAAGFLRWKVRWPYTRTVRNAGIVRHAISIDEKRRPYREYVVERAARPPFPDTDEVWFAGVHSDVGGTFDEDPGLPTVALKWILDGAIPAGLILKRGAYKRACEEMTLLRMRPSLVTTAAQVSSHEVSIARIGDVKRAPRSST